MLKHQHQFQDLNMFYLPNYLDDYGYHVRGVTG